MRIPVNSATLYGSSDLQTSTAGVEIIPPNAVVANFNIAVQAECHIIVNEGTPVYMRANQITAMENGTVFSCKIVESGIPFNWIGESAVGL